jgi:Holliday junction resolvase
MIIESEKLLERKLREALKLKGGWGLKILSNHIKGLPDRLCLLPGGVVFFAEIKTTKKKTVKIQKFIHNKLRNLGFRVYVIDTSEQIKEIIENEIQGSL